jgi:DNA excision repair protein ERCC-1
LNMYCYRAGWTLILAHSVEEAAEYLESFKVTERRVGEIVSDAAKKVTKPPPKTVVDLTVDKDKKAMCDAAVNLLASIRSVSRTDAQRLIGTFGSVRNIAEASVDQLSLCPGLGEQKAKRLHDTLRDSFIVNAPKKSGRSKPNDVVVQ